MIFEIRLAADFLPFCAIEKLLKFLQISYGYLLFNKIHLEKYFKIIRPEPKNTLGIQTRYRSFTPVGS
jgi:hypothetical protein